MSNLYTITVNLKIISLNLWWGGQFFPAVLEFLKDEAADVVLLQEVYNGHDAILPDRYRSIEVLKQHLTYPEVHFAQAYLEKKDGRLLPHGNAILSKLPVKSSTLILMSEPTLEYYIDGPEHWPILPAPLQYAEVIIKDRTINMYNMHGVWDMEGDRNSPARRHMSEVILAEVSHKTNVVLAGDSNAKPSNPAMRALEKYLKPVFDPELESTFNMRRKTNPGYATAAVDLMYVSPNVKVVSADCPDVDISDHRPLVVTLEIS